MTRAPAAKPLRNQACWLLRASSSTSVSLARPPSMRNTARCSGRPPGSPVLIERWGGPQPLQGRVSRVEPGGFTKISALGVEEQRVRVIIELSSPLAERRQLGDGYRLALKIITRSQEGASLVPVSAVFPLPGGRPEQRAVFRIEGGRARLTEVELEARNNQQAWLRKGLAAGARVIVYPPATLKDGDRVVERKS